MVGSDRIKSIAESLWKSQSKQNWQAFRKALRGSGIRYYKTIYDVKLHKIDDLKKAYVLLYDGKFRVVTRIPIWENVPNDGITGATKYLIGLKVSNLVD